jgi:hypothetical protein
MWPVVHFFVDLTSTQLKLCSSLRYPCLILSPHPFLILFSFVVIIIIIITTFLLVILEIFLCVLLVLHTKVCTRLHQLQIPCAKMLTYLINCLCSITFNLYLICLLLFWLYLLVFCTVSVIGCLAVNAAQYNNELNWIELCKVVPPLDMYQPQISCADTESWVNICFSKAYFKVTLWWQ